MTPFSFRYQKYDIVIRFTNSCMLPEYKESMLRGSIGEMLLRICCIRDRNCENCMYAASCAVPGIYYQKLKIIPSFSQGKESLGCIFECLDFRKRFYAGDRLSFSVVYLGGSCIYFPTFLNALFQLGMSGIMNQGAYFEVESIMNSVGATVADCHEGIHMVFLHNASNNVAMDYIEQTISEIAAKTGADYFDNESDIPSILCRLVFQTPVTIQSKGKLIAEFTNEILADSIYRRIFLLNCLEGITLDAFNPYRSHIRILTQKFCPSHRMRYSNTQKTKIKLKGIIGEMTLLVSPVFLPYLFAGELLHIGKNASMGFGKYELFMDAQC